MVVCVCLLLIRCIRFSGLVFCSVVGSIVFG